MDSAQRTVPSNLLDQEAKNSVYCRHKQHSWCDSLLLTGQSPATPKESHSFQILRVDEERVYIQLFRNSSTLRQDKPTTFAIPRQFGWNSVLVAWPWPYSTYTQLQLNTLRSRSGIKLYVMSFVFTRLYTNAMGDKRWFHATFSARLRPQHRRSPSLRV